MLKLTPTIGVFATFEEGRQHHRYATRKEAADGIRSARAKGGTDINVLIPAALDRLESGTGLQPVARCVPGLETSLYRQLPKP